MLPELSEEEVRVVGCLIEKEATTPDQYPLTVNALLHACNQTSNRWPIVTYDESTVLAALHQLRERGLVRVVHSVHNRAIKYRHIVEEAFALDRQQLALLGVLLLRGPQTTAELRTRTERYCGFVDVPELEGQLERLAGPDPDPDGNPRRDPLVVTLARQPGQKEPRHAHLLAGEPMVETDSSPPARVVTGERAGSTGPSPTRSPLHDRVAALEDGLEALRDEVAALRADLRALRPPAG